MKSLPFLLAAALAACAPRAVVVVSPGYDSSRTQLVTIAGVADFPGAAGSGQVVADALEKRFLSAGYRLVARRQALPALRAALGDAGADATPDQIRAAGRALGADALAFGTLVDYTNAADRTVIADYPQKDFAPIYGSASMTAGREDNTFRDAAPGYEGASNWVAVPVEQITPAHIALTLALLDSDTGETLWTASAERTDNDLAAATDKALDDLMTAVAAKVRASGAARAPEAVPGPPPSLPPLPSR